MLIGEDESNSLLRIIRDSRPHYKKCYFFFVKRRMMSEKTIILQNQRHKIFFRQERIKARSPRKESCLNEVKNLSKERVPLNNKVLRYE